MEFAKPSGNLSSYTQGTRMRFGVIALTVGLGLAVAALKLGLSAPWRALLVVPFYFASVGLLSGLFNTCAGLASQGLRDVGDGPERIVNQAQLTEVKRLATRVMLGAAAIAITATAAFLAVP